MSTATTHQESSIPSGKPFNVSSFLAAFVAFAVERSLHHGGLSGAEDLKAGKKKRKKLANQLSLKEFALAYPYTPKEAGGSVKKWLMRQITDPTKIRLLVEALGSARGVIGKLGHQSSKGKKGKAGKKKGRSPLMDAATVKPLTDAGPAALGNSSKPAKAKKNKAKGKTT